MNFAPQQAIQPRREKGTPAFIAASCAGHHHVRPKTREAAHTSCLYCIGGPSAVLSPTPRRPCHPPGLISSIFFLPFIFLCMRMLLRLRHACLHYCRRRVPVPATTTVVCGFVWSSSSSSSASLRFGLLTTVLTARRLKESKYSACVLRYILCHPELQPSTYCDQRPLGQACSSSF